MAPFRNVRIVGRKKRQLRHSTVMWGALGGGRCYTEGGQRKRLRSNNRRFIHQALSNMTWSMNLSKFEIISKYEQINNYHPLQEYF